MYHLDNETFPHLSIQKKFNLLIGIWSVTESVLFSMGLILSIYLMIHYLPTFSVGKIFNRFSLNFLSTWKSAYYSKICLNFSVERERERKCDWVSTDQASKRPSGTSVSVRLCVSVFFLVSSSFLICGFTFF